MGLRQDSAREWVRAEGPARSGLDAALEQHAQAFLQRFGGSAPPRIFFAPGRVNLMGAHLDYNGGQVIPMAIDRGTFIALRPRTDGEIRLASTQGSEEYVWPADRLPRVALGRWVDYPLGVLLGLAQRGHGPRPVEVLFGGNLPIGAGLSSSASMTVGTAFALDAHNGFGLEPLEHVRVALDSERNFVGVRCGIMDPFAVGLAREQHLLVLDCKDESYEHLPLDTTRLSIGVADTGVRRELAQSEFNRRVAECLQAFRILGPRVPGSVCLRDVPLEVLDEHAAELSPAVARRARHVLEEVLRTDRARTALLAGDPATFGRMMTDAHASLRDLFEVSVPELDCLVEIAEACPGVLGARLTGAGFGGCVVFLVRSGGEAELREHIESIYPGRFGQTPDVAFFRGDRGPREVEY